MRVLQINTVCGFGSTGNIVVDISKNLIKKGHESYIAFGQGTCNYKDSIKIGTNVENHLHNLQSRIWGKQGYYSKSGTKKLIHYILNIKPDIIHLHNLHGNYLTIKLLFNFLEKINIPIVWTLHDCWAFTGKCSHYTEVGCYKWESECNHCPQIHMYPPSILFDRSQKMFYDKKRIFTSVKNMTIIPVSNWLAFEVKRSFLAKYPIVQIYNWINQDIFKPYKDDIRKEFKIGAGDFIILGVSAGWVENSKLMDFIKLSKMVTCDTKIVLLGKLKTKITLPTNIIHIPYINDKARIAKIYSMAGVYFHASTEDTFGKVVAEAQSCGTPVIVYNQTALPELVCEGCGYVLEKRNINSVLNAINKIKANKKEYYSEKCRKYTDQKFNMKINLDRIIQLYTEIIENGN